MGWDSQRGITREQIVAEAVAPWKMIHGGTCRTMEHAESPSGVWMAKSFYSEDGFKDGPTFLAVRLIEGDRWKDMDETIGPYASDCPASVFDALDPLPTAVYKNFSFQCRDRIAEVLGR